MDRYTKYLEFIKKFKSSLGYRGDYSMNEIEIIEDVDLFEECERASVRQMSDKGVSEVEAKERALIGIRDKNRWGVTLCEPVRLPNGSYGTFVRFIPWGQLKDGVSGLVIVPMSSEGKYIFIKTFRNATRNWNLEFPRGSNDVKDAALKILRAEVNEELGANIVSEPIKIGEIFPDSGLLYSKVDIYKLEVEIDHNIKPEATESIGGIVLLSPKEIEVVIKEGKYVESGQSFEFKDAFTLSALQLLRA